LEKREKGTFGKMVYDLDRLKKKAGPFFEHTAVQQFAQTVEKVNRTLLLAGQSRAQIG
jgi:hypothetical protein